MIFIVVKWTVRPESAPRWLELVDDFTRATRAEPGCLFFEWNRSVDADNVFTLVEAFRDGDAGAAHVQSEHFRTAISWMGEHVEKKPDIVNVEVPQDGWGEMGEVSPTRE
jgi:quinol monooxygenase YgiN